MEYDPSGNIVSRTWADGKIWSYTYLEKVNYFKIGVCAKKKKKKKSFLYFIYLLFLFIYHIYLVYFIYFFILHFELYYDAASCKSI